jgi:hypothetical protein
MPSTLIYANHASSRIQKEQQQHGEKEWLSRSSSVFDLIDRQQHYMNMR